MKTRKCGILKAGGLIHTIFLIQTNKYATEENICTEEARNNRKLEQMRRFVT
jgi:hypothetical protein